MAPKRNIMDFDPNKSDSDDENFEPGAGGDGSPRKTRKKNHKPTKPKTPATKRQTKYRGSNVDSDDEDTVEDSELEESFGEDEDEGGEGGEDKGPTNATGRRMRKAASKQQNYRESSDEDEDQEGVEDSEIEKPQKTKASAKSRFLITLKTRPTRSTTQHARKASNPSPPVRRATRQHTEEADLELVELSTSGKHANVVRASRSRSPDAFARSTRATRGGKGIKGVKHPPVPIEEATQESSGPRNVDEADEPELIQMTEERDDEGAEDDEEAGQNDEEPEVAAVESVEEPDAQVEMTEEAENAEEEAAADPPAADDEDDDDVIPPPSRRTRASRGSLAGIPEPQEEEPEAAPDAEESAPGTRRLTRKSKFRKPQEASSDFDPGDESGEAEDSGADKSAGKGKKRKTPEDEEYSSSNNRGRRAKSTRKRTREEDSADELVLDRNELAEELMELRDTSRLRRRRRSPSIIYQEPKRRRVTKPVDYSIKPLEQLMNMEEEEAEAAPTPARGRRGARNGVNTGWERNLNTTYGPFGGGVTSGSLLSGPWGTGATGGVDSDSSDDEMMPRSGMAGNVGMTPTSAAGPGLFGGLGAALNLEGVGGGMGGTTPNVGKIKSHKALADADPLGVDLTVDFSNVGGLQGHIDQLKEMVQLPLLYPELFTKFHVTPPRGVLFHGPPGTGKTLLARALANSIGSGGRKITFYMRKGADALSKWVGEAEKQLRLLFEEARRTQPSIIFFDEIDGLAPVRSSKQEQIHASIVSTLLALMDGMDGRGQVIVIGATNRPDNIDPALRRPGRFDREFYFPLPDVDGRRAILDIHTKDWGLGEEFKNSLAQNTKGYGGADLRALCTEAALNSIQRSYPQIYSSKEKLIVDPEKISIHATDFMISIKKMVPSSERSASSGAAPLPSAIEPLLQHQFAEIKQMLDRLLPRKKKLTALEEAMYEPYGDTDHGFGREKMNQEFERARIFRPRLLITGEAGMGQGYISSALLHYFESVHVQRFDLPTLLGDGRPVEQVIVGMFAEVKRHKPSVIFIPNIEDWDGTITEAAFTTFLAMLKSIPPTEAVLLLATSECEFKELPDFISKNLFVLSKKNVTVIERPSKQSREKYFSTVLSYIGKHPLEFPDPTNRKKRVLEELPVAPPTPVRPPTKAEMKMELKRDHQLLNVLKVQLQPIMDQINRKYKKFRQPVIPQNQYQYLFDELDPNYVRPDLAEGQVRPFEIVKDKDGTDGLIETATGKFYYNLETTTIEERLSNGFYARPKDFLKDIRSLAKDSKNIGDKERTLKANELLSNVEVDVANVEAQAASVDWEKLHQRQLQRSREAAEKERKRKAMLSVLNRVQSDLAAAESGSPAVGPVRLGEPIPGTTTTTARFQVMSPLSNGHNTGSGSHPLSNGTSVPSRPEGEDVAMGGTEDDTQADDSMKPPSQWPSARATAGTAPVSQISAVTSVPPGVSPSAIANEASTTKTSDPSNRSSGGLSTQRTNGFHHEQQFSPLDNPSGSQIPDTQPLRLSQLTSSDGDQWPHSQAQGLARGLINRPGSILSSNMSGQTSPTSSQIPPGSRGGGGTGAGPSALAAAAPALGPTRSTHAVPTISNILNSPVLGLAAMSARSGGGDGSGGPATSAARGRADDGESESTGPRHSGTSAAESSQAEKPHHDGLLRVDDSDSHEFLRDLTERTSGCTIEQLEQINRDLVDEVWRTKHEWNRVKVLAHLRMVFNESIRDIEEIQGMGPSTQEREKLKKERERASRRGADDLDDMVEVSATQ